MYDRRLDAIVAAAELGSFSKAAEKLSISTPALVKQVTTFEGEHGLTLFIRSHTGVRATEAGESIAEDARKIIAESSCASKSSFADFSPSFIWRLHCSGLHNIAR